MNPIILYDNKILTANLTALGTAAGYDIQNIKDVRPNTFWKASGGGTNYIRGFWSGGIIIDAIGICSHNLGTLSATIYIENSVGGSNWSTVKTATITNDNALMLTFTSTYNFYWRIRIVTTLGAPYVGVLFMGTALNFEYPPQNPVTPKTKTINAEGYESEVGNILGASIKFNKYEISHTFNEFTVAWYDNYYDPFMSDYAEQLKPFFYALDLINKPNEIYYLMLKQNNARADQYERTDYYSIIILNAVGRK